MKCKKIVATTANSQLIFLEKCLTHDDLTTKSSRITLLIKSEKIIQITKKYLRKLLILAKNDTNQRLRTYDIKVNDLSQELKNVLAHDYFEIITHHK